MQQPGYDETLTLNSIQCPFLILRVQVPQRLSHHQAQFDFIVQTDALRTENRAASGKEDRGRGLEEEERLLWLGVVQLGDVVAGESIILVSIFRGQSACPNRLREIGLQGETHA